MHRNHPGAQAADQSGYQATHCREHHHHRRLGVAAGNVLIQQARCRAQHQPRNAAAQPGRPRPRQRLHRMDVAQPVHSPAVQPEEEHEGQRIAVARTGCLLEACADGLKEQHREREGEQAQRGQPDQQPPTPRLRDVGARPGAHLSFKADCGEYPHCCAHDQAQKQASRNYAAVHSPQRQLGKAH